MPANNNELTVPSTNHENLHAPVAETPTRKPRSGGPRSPEGKLVTPMNGYNHGNYAKHPVLRTENEIAAEAAGTAKPASPPARRAGGPKTAAGRARCSMNALKHGKYAKLTAVLNNEDPAAYREYLQAYINRYQPADPTEHQLVSEVAAINWRLNRIIAVETRSIDLQLRLQNAASESETYELTKLAAAVRKLTDDSEILESLARQQLVLIRSRQAILDTLFRAREKQPTQERTPIPNPDSYIDPETDVETVGNGRQNQLETDSNRLQPEPAR